MHWVFLFLAILFEVGGTVSMKFSEGFTRLVPSILLIVFYLTSFSFLTFALKAIDVSIAYAIWSGMGIVLISIIGYFYFSEQMSLGKVIAILFILGGVIFLQFTSKAHS